MGGVKTISIIVAANIKGLESGLKGANKSIAGFASKAARVGSMLSFGVTAPLTALGKSAFDTFSQFENGMMKVKTVTGASADELKMLTSEAKRLGATTQFTASQVADLQLVLGRKGFDPTAIKDMEGSILDLALATGEDLSLAAETVSASINAFGLESSAASSVANTLASAAANSSIQLSTFSTAFGHAGSSAKAVGVDIEELSAMMGVLMDNGIKASKAGTGLRKAFIRLNEEGIPFGQTLDRLSEGSMGLTEAQGLVGDTAANQLMILARNREKISELTTEYQTNTGRLREMADAMGKTTHARIKKMQSAIEGMKLEMGALIADAITPIINKITSLAGAFTNLDDRTKKIILVIAGVAAAIGPMLLIVAAATAAYGYLAVAIGALTSPIGLAVAALLIIPIALKYIVDNWEAFSERLSDWSWWKNMLIDMLRFFVRINPFNQIIEGFNFVLRYLGKNEIPNPFDTLNEALVGLKDETKEYEHEFGSLTDSIKDGVKNLGIDLPNIFGNTGTSKKPQKEEPKTRSLKEAYDAIFGEGAWDAYQEDIRLKQEQEANAQRWTNALSQMGLSIANSFASSFADVLLSGDNLLQGLKKIFIDLAKQILAMIIKAAILSAILSTIPGLGQASAASGAFGGATNFSGILQSMMGDSFASGGQPPLGKVSLVGEAGPELFVPNQKGTIIPNGDFGGPSIPDVKITGDDLLIVFDRANRRKDRR
jgi:hypothetical protein